MSKQATPPIHDHAPQFEVRLLAWSPLSPILNGALIVVILYGSYLAIALNTGQDLTYTYEDQVRVNPGSWAAFVLSLIFASAITMSVLGHRSWQALLPDVEATVDESGRELARAIAVGPSRKKVPKAVFAFVLGMLVGIAMNALLIHEAGLSMSRYLGTTGAWFAVVLPLLFGFGVRAAFQLGDDDKDIARLVLGHVSVEIGELERLRVYGQLATRSALSWLVIAGVILLFFIYSDSAAISIGTLVLSLAAGSYAFATTVRPVVKLASGLRDEALARVRHQIAEAGQRVLDGQTPETALSELTAYEAWLEKRPVWPISAPITRRLALYGLIPVLAWFGAAAAELLLGRLAS